MSIITYQDFKGEQTIAQLSNAGVRENLQIIIDEYEPLFLKSLLGKDLANQFVEGLAMDPIDPLWIYLRDETDIKPMLVRYVYYWFSRNNATTTVGTGEAKSNNENSRPVSPATKQVKAWNDMSRMTRMFDLSTAEYPTYVRPQFNRWRYWYFGCPVADIYYPITVNNI